MPAIASLEDLKAAQKEGLDIYAMPYALFFFGDGGVSGGKIFVSCGLRRGLQSS